MAVALIIAWLAFAWLATRFVFPLDAHDRQAIKELQARNASWDATAEKAGEVPGTEAGSAGFETFNS
jgi:hypothetical protein